jgi:hypothetical protein
MKRAARGAGRGALILLFSALPVFGQEVTPSNPTPSFRFGGERLTYGASFAFGIGTVNWLSVTPEVGYLLTDRLWTGANATLQFTNDTSYSPDFNSFGYGFGLFARFQIIDRVFATAEWRWESYESRTYNGGSVRYDQSSLYLGGGYAQPIGGRSALLVELLYDVTGNATGIGGSPFLLQVGIAAGF